MKANQIFNTQKSKNFTRKCLIAEEEQQFQEIILSPPLYKKKGCYKNFKICTNKKISKQTQYWGNE